MPQRRLVKILEEYNLNNEAGITRQGFIDYITEVKLWPRINYFGYKKDKFYRKMDVVLGDCIRSYGYIGEDDDRKTILVTTKGRDFIKPFGFFEELLKRRKRTSHFLFGGAFGAIISGVIVHFWSLISSKLGL